MDTEWRVALDEQMYMIWHDFHINNGYAKGFSLSLRTILCVDIWDKTQHDTYSRTRYFGYFEPLSIESPIANFTTNGRWIQRKKRVERWSGLREG